MSFTLNNEAAEITNRRKKVNKLMKLKCTRCGKGTNTLYSNGNSLTEGFCVECYDKDIRIAAFIETAIAFLISAAVVSVVYSTFLLFVYLSFLDWIDVAF